MLRRYSSSRKLSDNIKLGVLTAFSAGMVNVSSLIIFFAFTSNVTGHYAILAQEISKGNWYQATIVFLWICLFFTGSFISIACIVNNRMAERYFAHALPLLLEMACILFVGFYLQNLYSETLWETELLVAVMILAMGLQNGLTASISNSVVKTTHLTGLTTYLAIVMSMLLKKENRSDKNLKDKAFLLYSILGGYMTGGILSGWVYLKVQNNVFFVVLLVLSIVLVYDLYMLRLRKLIIRKQPFIRKTYVKADPAMHLGDHPTLIKVNNF